MAENQSREEMDREMECSIYTNYQASEVFVQGLAGLVNQQDVESMIRAQKRMLQRFEKTNEMLSNCNSLSASRLERASKDFKQHVSNLNDMKKDLEIIFKRIKSIKSKVSNAHPETYTALGGSFEPLKEEDDEYDAAIKERKAKQASNS